jgi:4-hydroxy-2-oxoheptanedioate aldolase
MGKGAIGDPVDPEVLAAIGVCREAAVRANKRIGIFCTSGAAAARYAAQGFDFVVPNHDANLLKAAVAAEVVIARG